MNFNNNPMLYPKEDGLNPFKAIIERINTLEGVTRNYGDSFETKELNVTENAEIENLHATEGTVDTLESTNATVANLNSTTTTVTNLDATTATVDTLESTNTTVTNLNSTNGIIKNAEVEELNVTEEIKVENLKTEEPILSNAVVGFDENGKIIPIRIVAPTESSLYFDYTVDSQQKFDDLLSILKNETPSTYRSVAILGGLGDGEHGEYLYTVDSDSGEADLNNASFIGFNNPKIVITADDADTFKVLKNGLIKDVIFDVGGTVLTDNNITLLYNCNVDNCEILHNSTPINFIIESCTLNKIINNEYITFTKCTLKECETIQSVFNDCSSEMLYVSTDSNITSKYSFDGCGIHLDMKKADMTQLETVIINISSMTDSKLTVLDDSSNLKKIILNVDASDSLSEIIGNNDKKYSIYEPFVKRVSKSISPSMRSKAYLGYRDESHTPIFSNDGVNFYIDEAMTQQVYCYGTTSNNKNIYMFALANDNTHCYSSLTLNKEINYSDRYNSRVSKLKLSDFGDEFILNGNPLKTYICRNDESGTLLYSNDNGTTLYISPYIDSQNIVKYANTDSNEKIFILGDFNDFSKTLGTFNEYPVFETVQFETPQLLEVTALKDNYAVQVVSNYDVPIYVENAFSTKVKND